MKDIWKVVERATNVAVIVAICLVAVFFYNSYRSGQPDAPKIGATLPVLPSYSWQSNPQSLVLAIRKGCHFCEASMPFYRKLYDLEKSNALKVKMIAVLPDSATDALDLLSTQKLSMPFISGANLPTLLSVSGTPTLILVDRNGKVEKTWVGQLNSAGEESVLAATENASQQGRENF